MRLRFLLLMTLSVLGRSTSGAEEPAPARPVLRSREEVAAALDGAAQLPDSLQPPIDVPE